MPFTLLLGHTEASQVITISEVLEYPRWLQVILRNWLWESASFET